MDEFERLVVITSGGDAEDRSPFQFRTAISILFVATELSLWLQIYNVAALRGTFGASRPRQHCKEGDASRVVAAGWWHVTWLSEW